MQSNELMHYGVKGMKWGVRRARKKEAKANYRKATNKAFAEYERTIGRIEKPYKRGQNLSDRDMARESAAEKKYRDAVAKAKSDYKNSTSSVNKNYTAKQRKQDRAFYGKRGEKRINKRLNEGHGLLGARHYEAERKARAEKNKRIAKKGAKITTKAISKIGSAYISDQVFFGGVGTRAVKSAINTLGRATITAFVMARGGHDVKWYDKHGRRVG